MHVGREDNELKDMERSRRNIDLIMGVNLCRHLKTFIFIVLKTTL